MNIKHLLYAAGVLSLTAACTTDDQPESAPGERVPITLSYTTQPQVETRAYASATLNDDNIESGQSVIVRISNYNVGSYSDYIYTTGAAGALTLPSPAPYYPINGTTNIDILAYTPNAASITSTGKFTIQTDQSTDANYIASDLLWATPVTNQARTTDDVTLTFAHKMAKIKVVATAGTAVSQINSIQLLNVKPTVDFSSVTGLVSNLSGDATSVTMATGETGTSVTAAAVIPEQTYTSSQLLAIGVTLNDNTTTGTAYYSVDSKTFEAGNVYTLNITVSYPEVNTTTAITGWADNGSVTIQPSVLQQTFDVDNNAILTFNVAGVQFQMIGVKGGNYSMTWSSTAVSGTLSSYYIGQTEVTNALWNAVMGSKPTGQKSDEDNYPVACVSWEDISTASTGFLAKLNDALSEQLPTGKTFKLPSEAQWQYAAIGGSRSNGYTYAGSNYLEKVAWWGNNGTTTHSYNNPSSQSVNGNSNATTHPVGLLMPNELGLFDMTGNVWEWCQDWYDATITASQGTDYVNTTEGSNRVNRGGSWSNAAAYCAVSNRHSYAPTNRNNRIGLRLVLQ